MSWHGWKISAAEKWHVIIMSQKHCQRPAAGMLGQYLMRELVYLVEIWSFLAIHFDVDEMLIHDRGGGFVFERFMCHHMTPVTGGISNRQQNGFAAVARQFQTL